MWKGVPSSGRCHSTESPLRPRGSLTPVAQLVRFCVHAVFRRFRRAVAPRGSEHVAVARSLACVVSRCAHCYNTVTPNVNVDVLSVANAVATVAAVVRHTQTRPRNEHPRDARCSNLTSKHKDRPEGTRSLRGRGNSRRDVSRVQRGSLSPDISRVLGDFLRRDRFRETHTNVGRIDTVSEASPEISSRSESESHGSFSSRNSL